MRTFNRATIIGRVGSEVVLRSTTSGKPVVNLSIATNERRKDGIEATVWHRTVLWDRLAEYANTYLRKGDPVYLAGRIGMNQWVDKEGVTHMRTEITARELIGLQGRRDGGSGPEVAYRPGSTPITPPGQRKDGAEFAEVIEEIPF